MKAKALRYVMLVPFALAIASLLQPLFPANSSIQQFFMSTSSIVGMALLALVWFLYFSGYKFARKLLLIQGGFSLMSVVFILVAYWLNINYPGQKLLVPQNTAFLLNLTLMFMASYLIQIFTYWLPRTKVLVNGALAVIIFMALLSIFGHVYSLNGTAQGTLLLPMPFGDIIGFLVLSLVIFVHTNRMERLYLSNEIILSFAVMFIAIVSANVIVYANISRTIVTSLTIDKTRGVLLGIYNVEFYLDSARTKAQAYEASGDTKQLSAYRTSKQAYRKTVSQLETKSAKSAVGVRQAAQTVVGLGDQVLALSDKTIAARQSQTVGSLISVTDKQIDVYMDQLLTEVKSVSVTYTGQIDQLSGRQESSGRGIMLGVSITSALSLLLILFTPLFIRQMIQNLSATRDKLRDSNRQLSDEKSRAEAVLTSMGDGLFVVDPAGIITVFNRTAETVSGVPQAAALGKQYSEVLKIDSMHKYISKAMQGTTTGSLVHNTVLHRGEDRMVDVQVAASPIMGQKGAVSGVIVVFRDRSNEQALENAKDEFVSLASHQLRTPATATKQFLAMFLQGYAGHIDDQQRLFLQQAYDNNELGINIIEDLLNITRLESNRLKLVKEKIELGAFLRNSAVQHKPLADKGSQSVKLALPDKPVYIETDVNLLTMAVDNLVTNALKYSDAGDPVTIHLRGGAHATIAVSDQGIGIKPQDLPKIFGRFKRLEDPQKQYVSGTGIGLYLVKKIARKMHATIDVESDYGKGSTFTLTFKSVE